MYDAGEMRERITFQKYNGARDSLGDLQYMDSANWRNFASVWASLKPIAGREFYAAEQHESEVTHNIGCRYRAGLETEMRILLGSRIFRIIAIIDWENRHERLQIKVKELVR